MKPGDQWFKRKRCLKPDAVLWLFEDEPLTNPTLKTLWVRFCRNSLFCGSFLSEGLNPRSDSTTPEVLCDFCKRKFDFGHDVGSDDGMNRAVALFARLYEVFLVIEYMLSLRESTILFNNRMLTDCPAFHKLIKFWQRNTIKLNYHLPNNRVTITFLAPIHTCKYLKIQQFVYF